jgi:hypothetical protein
MLLWNRLLDARGTGFLFVVLFIQVFVLAVYGMLIWLVARRRQDWARWMLVLCVVGVPFPLI